MSTFEPGTVAVATVRGMPNVRVFRSEGFWRTATEAGGNVTHWDYNGGATDVRPLVVLDPDDTETLDRLVTLFQESWSGCEGSRGIGLAGALRNLTKPPRIPEPGLWGVVEASFNGYRAKFVRMVTGPSAQQWADDESRWADWSDLIDPTLVRDGIEGAS